MMNWRFMSMELQGPWNSSKTLAWNIKIGILWCHTITVGDECHLKHHLMYVILSNNKIQHTISAVGFWSVWKVEFTLLVHTWSHVPLVSTSPNMEANSQLLSFKSPLKVWFSRDLDYFMQKKLMTCVLRWVQLFAWPISRHKSQASPAL